MKPLHLGFMKPIGERVRIAREIRNMSQMDLAKKSALSQSTIAGVESGKKLPSIDTLRSISCGLGLESWVFLYPDISLDMLGGKKVRIVYE